MKRTFLGWLMAALVASSLTTFAQPNSSRVDWFREARFGLFIHWGLYSVPAGQWGRKTSYHEWFQLQTAMSNADYEKFATQFNPTGFDARQWVRTAKDAGMKYIVITAKHHEGFSMFDTAYSDYNVVKATPFKRDPMKELAEACRESGIKLGFFYALPDWHHPELPAKYNQRGFHGGPKPDADISKYVEYTRNQVRELLTQYGPVGILWFDGGSAFASGDRAEVLQADKMVAMIHELQPDCLINNRLGAGGDYATPERAIPARASGRDFEVCMTLNDHWGYNRADQNWKPSKTVIRNLAEITGKGGNLLLNVGPTAEGVFPDEASAILRRVGDWIAINGESIYGTQAGPFRELPWGSCTMKPNGQGVTLYAHVFDWPASGTLILPGLKNRAELAWMLSDKTRRPLKTENTSDGLLIRLPQAPSEPIASTIVLQIQGTPEVEPEPIPQLSKGDFELSAVAAIYHGTKVQLLENPFYKTIAYWSHPEDWVEWKLKITQPGKFLVLAEIAAVEPSKIEISASGQKLTIATPVSGSYSKFQTTELGVIEISSGTTFLAVRPVKDDWHAINLKAIRLRQLNAEISDVVSR